MRGGVKDWGPNPRGGHGVDPRARSSHFKPEALGAVAAAGASDFSNSSKVMGAIGAIVVIVAAAVGGGIALTEDEDSNGRTITRYGPNPDYVFRSPSNLKKLDDELLAAFGRNGKARIADLYATGIKADTVALWATDAFARGLVRIYAGGYRLTDKGRKAAAELRGN